MIKRLVELLYRRLIKLAYLIPPIQILILFILASIELLSSYRFKESQLFIIGFNLGNSTLTLLIYLVLFFNPRLRYCLFTKAMVIGLVLNQILYYLSNFISSKLYDSLYTILSFSVVTIGFFIYRRIKKNKRYASTKI